VAGTVGLFVFEPVKTRGYGSKVGTQTEVPRSVRLTCHNTPTGGDVRSVTCSHSRPELSQRGFPPSGMDRPALKSSAQPENPGVRFTRRLGGYRNDRARVRSKALLYPFSELTVDSGCACEYTTMRAVGFVCIHGTRSRGRNCTVRVPSGRNASSPAETNGCCFPERLCLTLRGACEMHMSCQNLSRIGHTLRSHRI